jgi:cyanophycinase-like exopeptidase
MKVALLALLLATALSSSAQTVPNGPATYRYFRVGATANIQVHPRAGYALMGGGTDLDEAFRWLCDRAAGGDFLVIRATGTDAYNPYIQHLCRLNSVATLIIPDRAAAGNAFVTATITNAAALFISGGDQARYINYWAETPVETALRDAVKRGIPIGGTSAGLAVLGQYIYSAQNDPPDGPDLTSEAALADPFNRQVVIVAEPLRHAQARRPTARLHGPHPRLGKNRKDPSYRSRRKNRCFSGSRRPSESRRQRGS